jgi:hypothetical protein
MSRQLTLLAVLVRITTIFAGSSWISSDFAGDLEDFPAEFREKPLVRIYSWQFETKTYDISG